VRESCHVERTRAILIVADDVERASLLAAVAETQGPVYCVGRVGAARALVAEGGLRFEAVLIDGACLDGASLELLQELRRDLGCAAVAVLCSPRDVVVREQARTLDAEQVFQPWRAPDIERFLGSALDDPARRITALVASFALEHELARREEEVLRHLVIDGIQPRLLARRMRVSVNTISTWRMRIRKKCDARSFAAVLRLLLLHSAR
jgi:DNA-binding NarL/FixJ family response regulator